MPVAIVPYIVSENLINIPMKRMKLIQGNCYEVNRGELLKIQQRGIVTKLIEGNELLQS